MFDFSVNVKHIVWITDNLNNLVASILITFVSSEDMCSLAAFQQTQHIFNKGNKITAKNVTAQNIWSYAIRIYEIKPCSKHWKKFLIIYLLEDRSFN